MDESKIAPNQHVFVSIVGQEIKEKVPLKPLLLMPPAKIVDNCLLLGFHRQFFCVRIPDIISKLKNKKTASPDKMSIKFYILQWAVKNISTHNMVTPCQKNRATCCMFSTDQYKKSRQMRFSTAGCVCYTQTRVIFNPAVGFLFRAGKFLG